MMTTCIGSFLFVGVLVGGAYLYVKAQKLERMNDVPPPEPLRSEIKPETADKAR